MANGRRAAKATDRLSGVKTLVTGTTRRYPGNTKEKGDDG